MAGRKRMGKKQGLPPSSAEPEPEAVNSGTIIDGTGHVSKCTPERRAVIIRSILEGNFRYVACQAAGIDRVTLQRWHKNADQGIEPYAEFWAAMADAEARNELENVRMVTAIARGVPVYGRETNEKGEQVQVKRQPNLAALQFLLERKGARRWAPKQHIEHSGGVAGGLPQVKIMLPAEEELEVPETYGVENDD